MNMKKNLLAGILILSLVFCLLAACDALFGKDEGEEEDTEPVNAGVTVTPATASVAHGGTQNFTADQTVTWTVSGGKATATAINANGRLSVAANETATRLTVKATSTADKTKSGTAVVTVTAGKATVTEVTVSPKTARVNKGGTRHFDATVKGTNNPSGDVTWSIVETGKNAGTTIDTTGKLTVAAGENLASFTVKATSTVDTTKSDTATVTIGSIVVPTDNRILNPTTQNTQLTTTSLGPITDQKSQLGNRSLTSPSPYGYEVWDETGSTGTASFWWYGVNQGGGGSF
jgi:hypothetical protein